MHKWIEKSIKIANAPGYLDKLGKIYIMKVNPERPLNKNLERQVRDAFKEKDTIKGSDRVLKEYAKKRLGCRLNKGIDILFKKNNIHVIGEAKFLTTPGGEQDRGFDDASNFVRGKSGKAKRIALIDGYVWLKSEKGLYNKITKSKVNIFSALILREFIKKL